MISEELKQSWIEKQKKEKDWRPDGYYKNLRHFYSDDESTYSLVYKECENIGWKKAMLTCFIGYYYQFDDESTHLHYVGDIFHLNGKYEILDIDYYNVIIGDIDLIENILEKWICKYHMPREEYDTSNYNKCIVSIIEQVSKHWIAEMYALYDVADPEDLKNYYPLPWDYTKIVPKWSKSNHKLYTRKFKKEVKLWLLINKRCKFVSKDIMFYIIGKLAL